MHIAFAKILLEKMYYHDFNTLARNMHRKLHTPYTACAILGDVIPNLIDVIITIRT